MSAPKRESNPQTPDRRTADQLPPLAAPRSPRAHDGVSTPSFRAPPSSTSPPSSGSELRQCGPAKRQWSLEDFDVGPKLGEGRFGKIYLAREKSTLCAVVIKCINKDAIIRLDMVHQLQREVELQHFASQGKGGKYILRLYAYFWDLYTVYIVLEYAEGGDLQSVIKRNYGKLPEHDAAVCVRDICRALSHLHSIGVLHRDVKPDNVLLRHGKYKLGDFTWAVHCTSDKERRRTLCGTLDYLSPEIVGGTSYGTAADMWSLGVLAYELLTGHLPFEHPQARETCRAIQSGAAPPISAQISADARNFVACLLRTVPSERPSADDCLLHSWLAGLDDAPPRPIASDRGPVNDTATVGGGPSLSGVEISASTTRIVPPVEEVNRALDLNFVGPDDRSRIGSAPTGSEVGMASGATATPLSSLSAANATSIPAAGLDGTSLRPSVNDPPDISPDNSSGTMRPNLEGVSAITVETDAGGCW